jgi:ABC-type sugar transport system substrate-binding protein
MKRVIVFAAALMACCAAFVFANGQQGGAAAGGAQAGAKKVYRIAYSPGSMANESQAYSAKMFKKYGPQMGFDVTILDGKGDAQVQAQGVRNAIAQKFDAIFINPNDINGIVPACAAAKKAGLVVGMFSSDLPPADADARTFFVGINDLQAGETAAKAFIKQFPNGANIIEVGGQAGHDAAIKRHDGFNKALQGTNIKVMDYKACDTWSTSQAMSIMEDMITKYGDKIQGVFCHWDNGATGCIQAIKAAKLPNHIFLVAVDGCRAGFDQVKAGDQDHCIMQNFATIVQTSLKVATKVLQGQPYDKVNFVPVDDVTKANINTFEYPEW